MISRIVNRIKRSVWRYRAQRHTTPVSQLSQREMVLQLQQIPHWEDKIKLYSRYEYSQPQGVWVDKSIPQPLTSAVAAEGEGAAADGIKVHYGCGSNLIEGWLNIDLYKSLARNYRYVNLLEKHPFRDKSVGFGFSEDMLEHITQAESIFFLGEVFRTLVPQGVMRLSFPGLEGVLERHYSPASETRVRQGEFEAYSFWDHIHFYAKDELTLVAKHIGFSRIDFVEYGQSRHPELCNLDTRTSQIGLNTYVELTK